MIAADLPAGELRQRLARSGLRIRFGPIVTEIRSPFEPVASAIALHYAAHEISSRDEFADFHVTVDRPRGVRRWVKPQAQFDFDGERPFLPLPAAHAFPLLEWGLNWCVSAYCHQYVVVHSAVVERGGRALLLPAPPGSGKSTLCAALVARGWRLLSDELALIERGSGRLIPLPRAISLKNESIPIIARFWPDAVIGAVVHDTLKGSVAHARPPAASVRLSQQSAAPGFIVLPHYRLGSATTLAPLSKPETFMRLVESAFNYSMHGRAGFDVLADLVGASACFRFTYAGALDEAAAVFDRLAARP